MKHISTSQLFKEQLASLGESRSAIILENFAPVDKIFIKTLEKLNVRKL